MKAKFKKNDKVKIVDVFNCDWMPMKLTKGKTGIVQGYAGALVSVKVDDDCYLYAEDELQLELDGTTEQLGMEVIDEFKKKMRKRLKKTKKTTNIVVNQRISWSEFFMGVAKLAAKRSRDPNTQVGACIVYDRRIISTGYNGMPHTCDECGLPLEREGNWLDTKYPYVVHAEMNAILNAPTTNLKKHEIYVTLFPCADCAKAILQAGITKVVYLEDKHPNDDTYVAAKKMFALSNIEVIKYEEDDNDNN